MLKRFFLCLLFVVSFVAVAQEGSSSIYSFYGIGDIKYRGNIETRSMGQLTVIPDSIHLNLENPALMSHTKLTTFGISGTFSPTVLKDGQNSQKAQRTSLDYLSVVLPAKKFAVGFGVLPYSYVGYRIYNSIPSIDRVNTNFGSGGVNRVYTSFSYSLPKGFSLGAEVNFNFGEIETTSTSATTIESSARERNTSSLSGFGFNFGLSHQTKITSKLHMFTGVTYQPEINLTSENERNIAVLTYTGSGQEIVADDVDIVLPDSKLKIPSRLTFGTGVGEMKKWAVGVQYSMQDEGAYASRYPVSVNAGSEKASRFSIGGYYIPKYTSFTSYFSRITYRGGFRYEATGLVINNVSILDRAVTFGFGFPLGGTFSNLNAGFEFGKKGTKNAGLIEENYYNISLALSFNDRWFQKRKFD